MTVKNKVQLITYADSLGGDLKTLNVTNNKYYMPNSRFLSSEYSESIP